MIRSIALLAVRDLWLDFRFTRALLRGSRPPGSPTVCRMGAIHSISGDGRKLRRFYESWRYAPGLGFQVKRRSIPTWLYRIARATAKLPL